ncbi:MAG: YciI-like protein [Candidatus Acidiferrum sp.]
MPYFALFYEVVDDFVARRAPFRDEHLLLAREAHLRGELLLAGALAEPADGALLIFRGPSPDAATSFAQNDPYVRHGLVKHWKVRPWSVVVGNDPLSAQSTTGDA